MYLKAILALAFVVACAMAVPLESSSSSKNATTPLSSDKLPSLSEPNKDKGANVTNEDKKISMEAPIVRRSLAEGKNESSLNETGSSTTTTTEKPKHRRDAEKVDDHKLLNATNNATSANSTTHDKPKNRREAEKEKDHKVVEPKPLNATASSNGTAPSDKSKVRREADNKPLEGTTTTTTTSTTTTTEKPKHRRAAEKPKVEENKAGNATSNSTSPSDKSKVRRDTETDEIEAILKKLNAPANSTAPNSSSPAASGKDETEPLPKKKITERDAEKPLPSAASNTTLSNNSTSELNSTAASALDEHRMEHNLRKVHDGDCDDDVHLVKVNIQERSADPVPSGSGKNETSSNSTAPAPLPPKKPASGSAIVRRRRSGGYGSSEIRFAVREKPVALLKSSGYEAPVVREAPVVVAKSSGYEAVRAAPVAVSRSSGYEAVRAAPVSRAAVVRVAPVAIAPTRSSSYESVRVAPAPVVIAKAAAYEEEEPVVIRKEPIAVRTPSYAAPSTVLLEESSSYGDDSLLDEEIAEVDSYAPVIASRKTVLRANRYKREDKPIKKDPEMPHKDNKVPDDKMKKIMGMGMGMGSM